MGMAHEDGSLEFSTTFGGNEERRQLLAEAARSLEGRRSRRGFGGPPINCELGDLVRELVQDQASFGAPEIYQITEAEYLKAGRPAPVRLAELWRGYRFYWMRFPIGLVPKTSYAFNRLEVKIVFNGGAGSTERPTTYQILPDKKFQDLVKLGQRLEVSLDDELHFSARVPGPAATASAGGGFFLRAGPFAYRVTKATIQNSGAGLDWAFWRLDGHQLVEESRPDLMVILQVPRAVKELRVDAALQAYRFFNLFAANLQDAILGLPGYIAAFFEAGTPLRDARQDVLTDRL